MTKDSRETIFFPLPSNAQRPIEGGCQCTFCKAHPGSTPMWDTLAVSSGKRDYTWTVHYPELTTGEAEIDKNRETNGRFCRIEPSH